MVLELEAQIPIDRSTQDSARYVTERRDSLQRSAKRRAQKHPKYSAELQNIPGDSSD